MKTDPLSFDLPSGGAISLPNSKVLLIEDELVIALDMAEDLESWSYAVAGIARNMDEAMEIAGRCLPALAIVDISLNAEHDGLAIAEALKANFNTQIIFLTANSDHATRARIISSNPMGYFFKPYSAYALRQLLETFEID